VQEGSDTDSLFLLSQTNSPRETVLDQEEGEEEEEEVLEEYDEEEEEEEDDDDDSSDDEVQEEEIIQGGDFDDMMDGLCRDRTSSVDRKALSVWNCILNDKGVTSSLRHLKAPWFMTNLALGLRYGYADSSGSRSYMEDRIYANCSLLSPPFVSPPTQPEKDLFGLSVKEPQLAFFGLFDGHNGAYVAEILQVQFAKQVEARLGPLVSQTEEADASLSLFDQKHVVRKHITDACAAIDRDIIAADFPRLKKHAAPHLETSTFAGSTAVLLSAMRRGEGAGVQGSSTNSTNTLSDSDTNARLEPLISIAHVGDCRAVLCIDGAECQLTLDHKPSTTGELARIEAAGGTVSNGRVGGALAVSRSFGDIQYKNVVEPTEVAGIGGGGGEGELEEKQPFGLWAPTQQVISKPTLLEFEVEPLHEFVVLASDGLWDVMSCQEVVNFARWQLVEHRDLALACSELVKEATSRSSGDNVSVVICALNQLPNEESESDGGGDVTHNQTTGRNARNFNSPKGSIPVCSYEVKSNSKKKTLEQGIKEIQKKYHVHHAGKGK